MPVRIKGNEKRAYDLYQFKKEYGIDDFLFSGLLALSTCRFENCDTWKEICNRLEGQKNVIAVGTGDEFYKEKDGIVYVLKENKEYRENVLETYYEFLRWKDNLVKFIKN